MPKWRQPDEDRGRDTSDTYPWNVANVDVTVQLLAVAKERGQTTIEKRTPFEFKRESNEYWITIPDREGGGMWYRFVVSVPDPLKPKKQPMLAKRPASAPSDAREFSGRYFKAIRAKVTWAEAKERCERGGGRLAVIPEAETWAFLKPLCGTTVLWLGATDKEVEGTWKWVDGTQMDFKAWAQAQPDNAGGTEHYLQTRFGGWNDAGQKDGVVVGYVCEWKSD